jgi:hypothetical protein
MELPYSRTKDNGKNHYCVTTVNYS